MCIRDRCDTVSIAGMGGQTIADILAAAPWTGDGEHLLQMCIRDRCIRAVSDADRLSQPHAARAVCNDAGLPAHEYGTGGRAANAVTALLSIRKLGV